MREMDKNKHGVCKNVYEAMAQMKRSSITMRNEALDEKMSFDRSNEIRKEQSQSYNKLQFYKNVVNAICRKG